VYFVVVENHGRDEGETVGLEEHRSLYSEGCQVSCEHPMESAGSDVYQAPPLKVLCWEMRGKFP